MSDDKIEWNIDECREIIRQLNQKGSSVKDYIARMYFQFRLQLSKHWTGKNYNKIIDYVNEYATQFRTLTKNIAVTIPTYIQDIINTQAQDGQGTVENFYMPADDYDHPDIWEVPHTSESADGAIKIDIDTVRQFFQESTSPSILNEIEQAKKYLSEYITVFENGLPYFNNNSAVQASFDKARGYQSYFITTTDEIIETIIDAAMQEINGIEDVNINTKRDAISVAGNGPYIEQNSTYVGGNNSLNGGNTQVNGNGNFNGRYAQVNGNNSFNGKSTQVNGNGNFDGRNTQVNGNGSFDGRYAQANGNGSFDGRYAQANGNGNFDGRNTQVNGNGSFDGRYAQANGNGSFDGRNTQVNGNGSFDGRYAQANGNGNFDGRNTQVNGNGSFDGRYDQVDVNSSFISSSEYTNYVESNNAGEI